MLHVEGFGIHDSTSWSHWGRTHSRFSTTLISQSGKQTFPQGEVTELPLGSFVITASRPQGAVTRWCAQTGGQSSTFRRHRMYLVGKVAHTIRSWLPHLVIIKQGYQLDLSRGEGSSGCCKATLLPSPLPGYQSKMVPLGVGVII